MRRIYDVFDVLNPYVRAIASGSDQRGAAVCSLKRRGRLGRNRTRAGDSETSGLAHNSSGTLLKEFGHKNPQKVPFHDNLPGSEARNSWYSSACSLPCVVTYLSAFSLLLALLSPDASAQQTPQPLAPTLLAGNIYELTTYDGHHQPTGRTQLRTVALHCTGATTQATLRQDVFDVSGRLVTSADLPARFATTGPPLLDVRAFVNGQLLHALQLSGLDLIDDSLATLPRSSDRPGQVLAPAHLTLKSLPGAPPRSLTISLLGRCLTSPEEQVRTTAGLFTCQRLTQLLEIDRFDNGVQHRHTLRLVNWVTASAGLVRAETYVGDTLFDETELTAIRPATPVPLESTTVAAER